MAKSKALLKSLCCCVTLTTLFSAISLVGCGKNNHDYDGKYFKVQFRFSNPRTGTVKPSVDVKKGTNLDDAIKQANPTINKYWDFDGYYTGSIKIKDPSKFIINGDVTIVIKYTQQTCNLNVSVLDDIGGSVKLSQIIIPKGTKVSEVSSLIIPKPETGWNYDKDNGFLSRDNILLPPDYEFVEETNNIKIAFYNPTITFNIKRDRDNDCVYIDGWKDRAKELKYIYIPDEIALDNKKYPIKGFWTDKFFESNDTTQILAFSSNSKITNISQNFAASSSILRSVALPNSINNIGLGAFNNCHELININIPKLVENLNNDVFTGCYRLEKITFSNNGLLKTIGENCFGNCKSLKNIELPSSVTAISRFAFMLCESLENIFFAQNSKLNKIDMDALIDCYNLKAIKIPGSVQEISTSSFALDYCSSLQQIDFSEHVFTNVPEKWQKFNLPDRKEAKSGIIYINNENQKEMWTKWFGQEKLQQKNWTIEVKQ